jgi:hypothetical protein
MQFLKAMQNGCMDEMRELLDQGANIEFGDSVRNV